MSAHPELIDAGSLSRKQQVQNLLVNARQFEERGMECLNVAIKAMERHAQTVHHGELVWVREARTMLECSSYLRKQAGELRSQSDKAQAEEGQ